MFALVLQHSLHMPYGLVLCIGKYLAWVQQSYMVITYTLTY